MADKLSEQDIDQLQALINKAKKKVVNAIEPT